MDRVATLWALSNLLKMLLYDAFNLYLTELMKSKRLLIIILDLEDVSTSSELTSILKDYPGLPQLSSEEVGPGREIALLFIK